MPRNIAPAVYSFADQPGCVIRAKNRLSGSIIGLYHANQAGLDESQGSWIARCDTHGATKPHTTSLNARMSIIDPTEWCGECKQAMLTKKPPRVRSYKIVR